MAIHVRGTALLSISDHICRELDVQYGALVGTHSPTGVVVRDAFALKSADTEVDRDFLQKKLTLLRAVNSNWVLVGLYGTQKEIPPAVIAQVESITSIRISVLFLPDSDKGFRGFSPQTNAEVALIMAPGESEAVAASTVQNHSNYTQDGFDMSADSSAKLHDSLVQLESRLTAILARPELDAESERRVVHLAQLVMNYDGAESSSNHELLTSHLCLLTSQVAAIDSATAQMNSHVSNMKKSRMSSRRSYDL